MAAKHKDDKQIELAKKLNHVPWSDEYEKMISGMLYNSFVPELSAARFKARRWCHEYNTTFPDNPDADFDSLLKSRMVELRKLLGHVEGEEVFIEPPFRVDYGCNISLGEHFYANFNLTILDCGLVTIGKNVMFGPNVSIFAATHEVEVQSRRDNVEYAKPVVIGDDCWVGGHAVIMPGVTVGKGCTIGASSVVTHDIPDWSVAMGVPARVVKKVAPIKDEASRYETGG
nr:hypothetical protein B0A51_02777 [Rachicladosporium sp. CCFEE 5018]